MNAPKAMPYSYKSATCVYSPFFSKLAPHSKIQFENSTGLRYEFLETLARSKKTHFCLKFSKYKAKLSKSNPVVEVRARGYL